MAIQHRSYSATKQRSTFDLSQQVNLQEAEQMYRDTLREKPAAGFDKVSIVLTKTKLGRVLRKLSQYDEALPMLRQALAVREQFDRENGDSEPMREGSVTREDIAKVHEATGNCESAEDASTWEAQLRE